MTSLSVIKMIQPFYSNAIDMLVCGSISMNPTAVKGEVYSPGDEVLVQVL